MQQEYTTDWWMWQMYRQVAAIIHQPSVATEARLRALICEYRGHWEKEQAGRRADPHECAMDYV